MSSRWIVYALVAVLALGAAIAIAGLPRTNPSDALVITAVPTTTTTTVPETTTTEAEAPGDTDLDGSDPDTTEPADTSPDTTEPETTEPQPPLPGRDELAVVTANGANVAGTASAIAAQLEELGYRNVLPLNGLTIVDTSTIYFVEGFEGAAVRLATDLELPDDAIAPIDEAPEVTGLPGDVELIAYIGVDLT